MLRAALLLTISNIFMTFAWYGHLRHMSRALWLVVIVSWGIAFFEYCFQVPANRIGYGAGLTAAQLKTMQEVITLVVFAFFAVLYLKEPIRWNTVAGFVLIAAGAALVYGPWSQPADPAGDRMGGSGEVVERVRDVGSVRDVEIADGAGGPYSAEHGARDDNMGRGL